MFLRIAQNYSILNGLIVTLIIVISVLRYAPLWIGLWLLIYWIYKILRPLIFTIDVSDPISVSLPKQLIRCLIITAFASALIMYIYIDTNYIRDNGTSNTIWLI